jgi:hypothetical protein
MYKFHCVYIFIGSAQEAMDRRPFTVGIFFDFTKAYDVIDHGIFL